MKIWPFNRQPRTEAKSLSDPEDWLAEMFGAVPTQSGAPVTTEGALRVPAVSSAVRVMSEAAASLDVSVKRVNGQREMDVGDSAALDFLKGEANDWTSGFELIRDLVIDALTRDEGRLAWVNWTNGQPREIIRYPAGRISVDYSPARAVRATGKLRRLGPANPRDKGGPMARRSGGPIAVRLTH